MSIELGANVDQSDPLAEAAALDMAVIQIMLGDPQSWQAPQVSYPGGAETLRADAQAAGVGIFVHAPYVINVASPNNRIRIPSRKLLQKTVDLATRIGARGVIVHGGHVRAGDEAAVGYRNWFKAVDGLNATCPVLIENTAGGKNAIARYLESLERLWASISESATIERIGFCLDTCHAHAAGLPMDGLVDQVRGITGRLDLVHLNDSRDLPGSGADRHANLGRGQVDPQALVQVVVDAGAPVILETPGGIEGHRADLEWLRQRLGR